MSTEPSPRAEQIQANVAAALNRLRGEPSAGAPQSPIHQAPVPQLPADQTSAETGLTNGEALFSVEGRAPATMGAPDPSMALGKASAAAGDGEGRLPSPFERLTGLKPEQRADDGDDQPDLLQGIGVAPPPLADLPDADEEARRRRRRRNRLMLGVAALALLAGFWFLTGSGDSPQEVPVIAADGSPERVKPEEEGGLSVPNQDVAILNNGETTEATTETVVPAPEQPAPPPAPAVIEPAAPAVQDNAATQDPAAVPAIPSVSAPDVAAIPSVPAPTELGAPATTDAAPAATTDTAATAATTEQPVAEQPAAEQPTEEAAAEAAPIPKVSAAIQPVPGGTVRIQLASVKSEDGARSEWARLQRTHPAILGGLELNIERFEKSAGDVYYRIQAGPLGDRASAKQICEDLKQKNQACIVAK